MSHANNGTSDLNAWVSLFQEFCSLMGVEADMGELFGKLYTHSLTGDPDCGGLLAYGYYSGENITFINEGRPLFVRTPESRFNLANSMRVNLYTSLGAVKLGMDILLKDEGDPWTGSWATADCSKPPGSCGGIWRRKFLKGALKKELEGTLQDLHLERPEALSEMEQTVLYLEFRNAARRYLSTCKGSRYAHRFWGLKAASEQDKRDRTCEDIWSASRGLAGPPVRRKTSGSGATHSMPHCCAMIRAARHATCGWKKTLGNEAA